mmetsp:Transcript_8504/g.38678  ORF Transcript_8504/g.38678 Transcript_8504/m.38678 type:complete len:390 (-) Transcript_8504:4763-5932(-)
MCVHRLLLLRVRMRLCIRRDGLGSTAGLHERGERMRRRSRRRGGRRRLISARLNLPPLMLLLLLLLLGHRLGRREQTALFARVHRRRNPSRVSDPALNRRRRLLLSRPRLLGPVQRVHERAAPRARQPVTRTQRLSQRKDRARIHQVQRLPRVIVAHVVVGERAAFYRRVDRVGHLRGRVTHGGRVVRLLRRQHFTARCRYAKCERSLRHGARLQVHDRAHAGLGCFTGGGEIHAEDQRRCFVEIQRVPRELALDANRESLARDAVGDVQHDDAPREGEPVADGRPCGRPLLLRLVPRLLSLSFVVVLSRLFAVVTRSDAVENIFPSFVSSRPASSDPRCVSDEPVRGSGLRSRAGSVRVGEPWRKVSSAEARAESLGPNRGPVVRVRR